MRGTCAGFSQFFGLKKVFSLIFQKPKNVLAHPFQKTDKSLPILSFFKNRKKSMPHFSTSRSLDPIEFSSESVLSGVFKTQKSHCPLFKTQRIALSPFFQKPKKSMPSFLKTEGSVDKPARVPSKPARVPNKYCPIP